jgi:DNA replication protein DnaC
MTATTSPPKCPCGAPVDPELLEIRTFLPSLSPDLCTACYDLASREDEARLQRDIDAAENRQRLARLDVIPPKILATDLAHPTFNKALFLSCQGWTPESRRWLVLHGPPGSCKTRIAGTVAKRLILAGHAVTWTTAGKLQETVEELHSYAKADEALRAAARSRLRVWKESGILVLDDLGKNTWTPSLEAKLFELIDHRETHWLPTILTSNRPIAHLVDDMSADRGGPIIGRILEAARGWIFEAKAIPA